MANSASAQQQNKDTKTNVRYEALRQARSKEKEKLAEPDDTKDKLLKVGDTPGNLN